MWKMLNPNFSSHPLKISSTSSMLFLKFFHIYYSRVSSLTPYCSKLLEFFYYILFFFFSLSLSLVQCLSPLLSSLFLFLYASLSLFDSRYPLQQWWATRRRGRCRHCCFSKDLVKGVMDVFPKRSFHCQCHVGHKTLWVWVDRGLLVVGVGWFVDARLISWCGLICGCWVDLWVWVDSVVGCGFVAGGDIEWVVVGSGHEG